MRTKAYFSLCALGLWIITFSLASAQAPANKQVLHVPGAVPLQFDQPITLDVESNAFKVNGSDLHVIGVSRGTFHLAPDGHMTGTLNAGVRQWVNANYWISAAVFDSRGQLLGTATHQEAVQYIRLGASPVESRQISLDFGISDSYRDARYVVVAISERKALPSQ